MAQHITRKELKKDEVRDTLAHGADALFSHWLSSLIIIIVALAAGLGFYGWRTYTAHQSSNAAAAFNAAMSTFQAPVAAKPTSGQLSFTDHVKKFTAATKQFSMVASKYPHTHAGRLSRYYAALSKEKLGKNDDARKMLEGLTGSHDAEVASLAKFELAGLDDRTGHGDEAAKLYQQLIDNPTLFVPKPLSMLALANHYAAKDPSRAAALYGQIKTEYPDSQVANEADQALAMLPAKS